MQGPHRERLTAVLPVPPLVTGDAREHELLVSRCGCTSDGGRKEGKNSEASHERRIGGYRGRREQSQGGRRNQDVQGGMTDEMAWKRPSLSGALGGCCSGRHRRQIDRCRRLDGGARRPPPRTAASDWIGRPGGAVVTRGDAAHRPALAGCNNQKRALRPAPLQLLRFPLSYTHSPLTSKTVSPFFPPSRLPHHIPLPPRYDDHDPAIHLSAFRSIMPQRDYCCCAIPVVYAGIYTTLLEQVVLGVVAGTLSIATPSSK